MDLLKEKLRVPFQCISNVQERGKKRAIRVGVHAAINDLIITWDADISFPPSYLKQISHLPITDLIILPVFMNSASILGKLAAVEFSFMETLGFGLGGMNRPMLCYGSNLGFRKDTFQELDAHRDDYEIASGDDMFLLEAMRTNNKDISIYSEYDLAVSTNAPISFKEIIQQRQRWFGKMGSLFNSSSILALILLVLVQIGGISAIILSFYNPLFLIPLGVKYLSEVITTWRFVKSNRLHWLIILIHQVWYPVYLIVLIFPFRKEDRWLTK